MGQVNSAKSHFVLGVVMKKSIVGRAVIAIAALALLANGIAPSNAATLRVPKQHFLLA